jgi:hypothetical protein
MSDDEAGMRWWNGLSEAARRHWLRQANSARPADAWQEWKRQHEADPVAADLAEMESVGQAIAGTWPRTGDEGPSNDPA